MEAANAEMQRHAQEVDEQCRALEAQAAEFHGRWRATAAENERLQFELAKLRDALAARASQLFVLHLGGCLVPRAVSLSSAELHRRAVRCASVCRWCGFDGCEWTKCIAAAACCLRCLEVSRAGVNAGSAGAPAAGRARQGGRACAPGASSARTERGAPRHGVPCGAHGGAAGQPAGGLRQFEAVLV